MLTFIEDHIEGVGIPSTVATVTLTISALVLGFGHDPLWFLVLIGAAISGVFMALAYLADARDDLYQKLKEGLDATR
jgi:mannose/fructose/N-acetylgalactosamine-specific phosphotransferase system component IIC